MQETFISTQLPICCGRWPSGVILWPCHLLEAEEQRCPEDIVWDVERTLVCFLHLLLPLSWPVDVFLLRAAGRHKCFLMTLLGGMASQGKNGHSREKLREDGSWRLCYRSLVLKRIFDF